MQTEQLPRDGDFTSFAEFSRENRAFPEGSLRWLRFNEATNGLAEAGAFVQVGRRVLIDKPKFFAWLRRGQRSSPPASATKTLHRTMPVARKKSGT